MVTINGGDNAFATKFEERFPTEQVWQNEYDASMALRDDDI
ncbi:MULTISPECIES: hypothetical protein [Corallococcus]|nr:MULTISPECIES: hypothetical protein [Corallococcus]